jgi:hypothetical protein
MDLVYRTAMEMNSYEKRDKQGKASLVNVRERKTLWGKKTSHDVNKTSKVTGIASKTNAYMRRNANCDS